MQLHIEATKSSPLVLYTAGTHTLSVEGNSYPENSFQFYEPLFEFVKNELVSVQEKVVIELKLIYFNSTTSKTLFDLFDLLQDSIKNLEIKWYYNKDNEFILEAGEDFKEDYPNTDIELICLD